MTNKIEELKKIDNKHLIPNVEEYIKTIEQEERKKTLAEVERAWCDFYNEFDLASDCTRDDKLFKRLWRKYHGELNMVNHRGIKFPMVSIAEVEKMIDEMIRYLKIVLLGFKKCYVEDCYNPVYVCFQKEKENRTEMLVYCREHYKHMVEQKMFKKWRTIFISSYTNEEVETKAKIKLLILKELKQKLGELQNHDVMNKSNKIQVSNKKEMKVVHKIKKRKGKDIASLLNRDGTWNVLCENKGSSSCTATYFWEDVTCKNCLKKRKEIKK